MLQKIAVGLFQDFEKLQKRLKQLEIKLRFSQTSIQRHKQRLRSSPMPLINQQKKMELRQMKRNVWRKNCKMRRIKRVA